MGKILQFKRVKREVAALKTLDVEADDIDSYIMAVLNDTSLTIANRHWILENMLMDIDDQLEEYRKALEAAERKLDRLVQSAEKEIADAYSEFNENVSGMTEAVKKLTKSSLRESVMKLNHQAPAETTAPDSPTTRR